MKRPIVPMPANYFLFLPIVAVLEDACFTVYEDKRKVIATNVSTCGLQKQSHKSKLRSNEVAKQPRLHIEHTHELIG